MDREEHERYEAETEVAAERAEGQAEEADARAEVGGRPVGVAVARSRFGGIDLPASFGGMLASIGFLVLLAGLLSAAMTGFGFQTGIEGIEEEVTTAGLIAGFITLFVAFLVGGWVVGRIARYDGLLNGFLAVVLTLMVAGVFGLLGVWLDEQYNFFADVGLPAWFTDAAASSEAIASGIAAIVVMILGALLGGWLGEAYHRRADYALAEAQDEGFGERRRFFRRPAFAPRASDVERMSPSERETFCREACPC